MNAPFSSQVPRFNLFDQGKGILDDILNETSSKSKKERKSVTRSCTKGIMHSKNPRF